MSKKTVVSISLALAAVVILPACLRQASQAPQPTATSASPFNMARPTGLSFVEIYGTQTAMALSTQPAASPNALTSLPTPTSMFSPLAVQSTPNALTPLPSPTTGFLFGTPATPTVLIVVPTATPGRPVTYTLQQGEYPFCLARRFNVNPSELLTLNNLADGQLLQAGTVLNIPQTGNPFPGNRAWHPHPTTFTVTNPEETIYGVACYFGDLDPTAIAAANSLVPPYTLHTGQSLNIP